jgi:hypothetical protein
MGKALEFISGIVTAPGATIGVAGSVLTMNSGDSKTIRNFPQGFAKSRLMDAYSFSQASGRFRIASPQMHDPINGIRMQHTSADPSPLIPQGQFRQTFEPQEILTMEASGSATGGDIEQHGALIYYDELPGINARLTDEMTIAMAIEELVGVEVALTAGTAGGYSGAAAINATVDNLKANRDYALLGGEVTVTQLAITMRGAETGNLRVAFPAHSGKKDVTRDYFVNLSRYSGVPCIPVFNASNKGGIFIETTNNENAASPVVTLFLALLKPGFVA